jgi:4'-phosphopantetheinyl transferase
MGVAKITVEQERAWAFWEITETETELLKFSSEEIPASITHAQKRLEWLSGRALTAVLMDALGIKYQGIVKDNFGKPYVRGYRHQLSLSHSYPYVAAILDKNHSVGIDLEQPKSKLLNIASRVLHQAELMDAGTNVVKHCVYWCAKEALIKIHGKKDLVLAQNLLIQPFLLKNDGDIIGKIIVAGKETEIPLWYRVYPHFVVAFNK